MSNRQGAVAFAGASSATTTGDSAKDATGDQKPSTSTAETNGVNIKFSPDSGSKRCVMWCYSSATSTAKAFVSLNSIHTVVHIECKPVCS